jgi:hypothetical protein
MGFISSIDDTVEQSMPKRVMLGITMVMAGIMMTGAIVAASAHPEDTAVVAAPVHSEVTAVVASPAHPDVFMY